HELSGCLLSLSDCIRLGVFLFLGLRSFSLRRNKEKECKCRVRGCISPDYKNIFVRGLRVVDVVRRNALKRGGL
ncbi:MAG: hypothetical protein ACI4S3_10745, partial [Candidatus Gastranaerophilaceae bacterium]